MTECTSPPHVWGTPSKGTLGHGQACIKCGFIKGVGLTEDETDANRKWYADELAKRGWRNSGELDDLRRRETQKMRDIGLLGTDEDLPPGWMPPPKSS